MGDSIEEWPLSGSKNDVVAVPEPVGDPLPWSACLEQELKVLVQSKQSLIVQKRRLKAQYLALEEDRQQWRHDVKQLKNMGVRCADRQVLGSVKTSLDDQSARMNQQVRMLRNAEKSVDARIGEVRQLIGPNAETAMGLGVGQDLVIPDFSNILMSNHDSSVTSSLGLYRKWRSYVPSMDAQLPLSARLDMPLTARGVQSTLSSARGLAPPLSARGLASTDSTLIGSGPLAGVNFTMLAQRFRNSSLYN